MVGSKELYLVVLVSSVKTKHFHGTVAETSNNLSPLTDQVIEFGGEPKLILWEIVNVLLPLLRI